MPNERKYPAEVSGICDADSAPFAVGVNSWVNSENIRTATTDAGVTETVESIGSNVLISQPQPSVTYLTIGNVEDIENNRIIKFQYNTVGSEHKIVCLFTDTNLEYDVLRSSQVIGAIGTSDLTIAFQGNLSPSRAAFTLSGTPATGDRINVFWVANTGGLPHAYSISSVTSPGWSLSDLITDLFNQMVAADSNTITFSLDGNNGAEVIGSTYANITVSKILVSGNIGGLNFSKDHPIHSARIINNLLYWTDNFNEPKKININKALKANTPQLPINVIPYTLPMVYPTETIIKRPPYYPLEAVKTFDSFSTNRNNYINDQAFLMLYFYEYCDFEWSKLSAYSPLLSFGPTEPSNENFITCKVPFVEPIDDDVQKVYIVTQYGNAGKKAIVKIFDKAIAADAAAIQAHNLGITQLTFLFYNNEVPIGLDDVQANTPFDRAPLLAEALEIARDRLFEGNILVGYDTPVKTSLTGTVVTVDDGAGGTFPGVWGYINLSANFVPPGPANTYNYPFAYVASGAPNKYYYFSSARVNPIWDHAAYWTPDLPPDVNISDADFTADDEATFVMRLKLFNYPAPTSPYTIGSPPWLAGYVANYTFTGVTFPVDVIEFNPSSTPNFLKSNGTYNITIDFKDRFRRKCGAVNKKIQLIIPQRTLTQSEFSVSIQWLLSNFDAVNEIPYWAWFYQILITKNLTTRFFLQGQIINGGYVVRALDGTFTYQTTYDGETQYATAFDVTALFGIGMGYVFTPGDKITVYLASGTVQTLPIIGQDGNNVLFNLTDLGTFPFYAGYEIYTPYIPAEKEPYYEASPVYSIVDAGLSSRAYSTLTDILVGDTYNIQRTLDSNIFIAETMSPNDRFWQDWETSTGWINEVTNLGQKRLIDQIAFSSTRIQDTQVNGLSEFLAINAKTIPEDCGGIMKLILSSKVQGEQGTVMLAICAGGQTASLYLGEVQITDNTGATQFFGSSAQVIGTINILKGNRGTINPESVSEYRGDVFFFDANNGVWVQYSVNGLDDIVTKFMRFWNEWSLKYKSLTSTEIEALAPGNRPFVFSVVDNKHKELLISIPKLSDVPPKGYLPDYPDIIYPFDILDFQAKTIVYKLGMAGRLPHYQGSMSFYAENFATLENKLYSFHNGLTYLHNQTSSTNNFYGVQNKSKIAVVSNAIPNVPKSYDNLSVQANIKPDFIYMYNEYPYLQSSDLVDYEIRDLEGLWYSTIRRNKLNTGVVNFGLLTGEKMRNVAMFVLIEFPTSDTFLELKFVQFGFSVSHGHANQLTK